MATIRFVYNLKIHHYGFANDQKIGGYKSLEEAQKVKQKLLINEGYAFIDYEKEVLLTEGEEALHHERQKRNLPLFDYRIHAYCYGIYTHWDGTREQFFVLKNQRYGYDIYFPHTGEAYTLMDKADIVCGKSKNKFAISSGEKLDILGGTMPSWQTLPIIIIGSWDKIPEVEEEE